MREWTRFLALVVFTFAATSIPAQETPAEASLIEGVAMRDGVRLATSIYLPQGDGPWPVILTRTPYDRTRYARRAPQYTQADYAFVVQDFRGRYESEGVYEPYQTEMEDGYDTIEWIAAQPWCNGKVGMSGRSAMGIAVNLAAAADPPHLVCGYVVTAPESLFDESYFMGGVFREHFRGNFMRLTGAEDQIPILKRRVVMDEQWRRTDLVYHRMNIDIPLYQVGGWYDMFAKGAINNFVALQYHGRDGARGNQKLWMGPWAHSPLDGDLEYPNARGLDNGFDEEMRWFDHWLKGIDNGIMNEPAMTYYHLAPTRSGEVSPLCDFRTTDWWPPPGVLDTRLYLREGFKLDVVRPTAPASTTSFIHDPGNPVPTAGGANYNNFPNEYPIQVGPVDQRVIGDRPDYLRFHSEPLVEPVTIQGRIEMELWVSTDAPDTDFMIKLIDVYPDGYEAILLDAPIRTRYRNGREPGDIAFMTPGKPTLLRIDLWSLSQTFGAGHRIGVHISSSNFPRFEVNPNTGEAPGSDTLEPRPARNVIHHSVGHPSALVIPLATAFEE